MPRQSVHTECVSKFGNRSRLTSDTTTHKQCSFKDISFQITRVKKAAKEAEKAAEEAGIEADSSEEDEMDDDW